MRPQGALPRRALLLVALTGCQPGDLRPDASPSCLPDRPEAGTIAVGVVSCGEMSLARGESSTGDFWLANDRFRVVVRHPQASLTLVGAGGGTVIDGAPWGQPDVLHEVAPLVGGGWLDVDEAEVLEDGLRFSGTVVSLPDRPAASEGERAAVSWRLAPDDPWLRFEGADGLWLHPAGELEPVDGWFWSDAVVLGHDGTEIDDLGGAVRVQDATGLFFGSPGTALAQRAGGETIPVAGTAPGADRIEVWRDDVRLGWFANLAEGFQAEVPATVDAVRGTSDGRASSAFLPPSDDLELFLGEGGAFEIRPAWNGARGRPLRIEWSAYDGRTGLAHLPAVGGTLFLGAGDYDLTVSAGPAFEPAELAIEAGVVLTPLVAFDMRPRFDPGTWVLGSIGVPVDRSRGWRGSDTTQATVASGQGADWVVFTADDDVADVSDTPTAFPQTTHRDGSRTVAPDGSWSVVSWPWSPNRDRPGHGAVNPAGLQPDDALAAAVGGITRDRHTVVDLGWLEQAPAPWAVSPGPEGVFLEPPGTEGPAAWAPWFAWLDAAVPLTPVGPLTWFEVANPSALAAEDFEQAFTAGRSVATTGPLLLLSVGDAEPGDVAPTDLVRLVHGELGAARDVDHVAVLGDGGTVLWQHELDGTDDVFAFDALVPPGRWLALAAWDDAGTAFAITAPLWVNAVP